MKKSREYTVGLFVLGGLILFAVFVFSISKFSGPTRRVLVEFSYVDGLGPDAPVQYAGYRVGRVESVSIVPGAQVKLIAKIAVPKDLPISRKTEVMITSMGLMGEKVVEILPAPDGEPLPEGEVLRGSDPVLLSKIFGKMGSIFDESTSGNIRQVTMNVVKLTEDLNVFSSALRRIGEDNGDEISRILMNTAAGSDRLPGLVEKIDRAATSLTVLSENLKGMAAENRPEIHDMVNNLNATSENLKALSDDVRRHPWKLIRKSDGEKPKKEKN